MHILFIGSYGTIELSVVFDEANELLVVTVIKAKVRKMKINFSFSLENKKKLFFFRRNFAELTSTD